MATKIHTKTKRYLPKGPERNRKPRFKTFLDAGKAKEHAEKLKLKKYSIVKMNYGLGKKYKIMLE